MDEMNGAFEEKKRRKGGKRLMQPEKAAKAAKEPRAEKPPRVPRETSGKTGKVVGIVAGVLVVAYLGLGAWASASHKIYPNVMMGDTNYGGMTEQQVAEQLKASVAQAKGAGVDFVLPDGTEVAHVSLDEMPEYVDFDGLAKHIYNVYGCNDSFLTAGAKYLRALFKPQDAAQVVGAGLFARLDGEPCRHGVRQHQLRPRGVCHQRDRGWQGQRDEAAGRPRDD